MKTKIKFEASTTYRGSDGLIYLVTLIKDDGTFEAVNWKDSIHNVMYPEIFRFTKTGKLKYKVNKIKLVEQVPTPIGEV